MKPFFIFFLRVFVCFVAAKFILRALGLDQRTYLIALTLIFTGNLYWFDFLEYRDRIGFKLRKLKKTPPQAAAEEEEVPAPGPPADNLEKR
ncbi:MAG: hypothetical protein PHU44_06615 [Syntrophales bacterium]|nr:hypothetical protein [Syntrophales bacterium]